MESNPAGVFAIIASPWTDSATVGRSASLMSSISRSRVGNPSASRISVRATDGAWLAFVDADTRVDRRWLAELLTFARREGLAAASSRCRMTGPRRTTPVEWTINHLLPRLSRPVLPGFGVLVERDAYEAVGGFPDVPDEDTAFSRRLGRSFRTAYHPDVLVETSGRRVADPGLTGPLAHYLTLDWRRLRAEY